AASAGAANERSEDNFCSMKITQEVREFAAKQNQESDAPAPSTTAPAPTSRRASCSPPGHTSNYADPKLSWIYFSGTLDAAIWGCELAKGEGRERIYIVAPTGAFEDDPNLTDKRFPGNPTKSYRSREPLR